jgi:GNAT superfamily N-acetyltransferase
MYAIGPIDPAQAPRFAPLTPFEVRHLLSDLAALPRVHAVGATLRGAPIGIGLAVSGWATDDSLGESAPRLGSGRVLTVRVAPAYRKMGVGRGLLAALESAMAAVGTHTLASNFAQPTGDGLLAIDGLLRSSGWNAREVTMLQCRADHALLSAPILR